MFGKRIELFKLFGFSVRLDASWFFIAVLVTWSLAQSLFPAQYPFLDSSTYWWMGALGALGLFASIVFHEMAHSLVARRFGMQMKGITLFIFGGVAEMEEEPSSPGAEFWMAIAGPLASVLLAASSWGLALLGQNQGWATPIYGVLAYLAGINGLLIAFNLIPAFPLDGGRVLRAALWQWKENLTWATRIASQIGSGFGILLIALGVFRFLSGDFVGGMWWALIGLFLRGAAGTTYQRLLIRRSLEGEPVRRFMTGQPVAVSPDTSVEELVENFIYRYHYKMLPVVHRDRLLGCVSTGQVREVPRSAWPRTRVGDLVQSCSAENSISPDADAIQALAQMNRTGLSRLVVRDGDRLAGVISLKDLLAFLAFKMELEGDGREVPDYHQWGDRDAVEPEEWSVSGASDETRYRTRKAG